MSEWFAISNPDSVASPALLLYPERIEENIRRMIQIAGAVERLRPHVKTHKLAEVVKLQIAAGISKFKCATIAEAEMTAGAGAPDVLLAFPVVGPNAGRLLELTRAFPQTRFSAVADDAEGIAHLSRTFAAAGLNLDVLLDIDCGQHRTGVPPGAKARALYQQLASAPGLRAAGLHAYDGHIHDSDPARRIVACAEAFAPVNVLRREIMAAGLPVPRVVAGGTPTFPIHARNESFECSPGTCLLWDFGYAEKFPDLDFLVAAVVLTRVVSRPGPNHLCLDLGHKAVASENPPPRVQFLNLPDTTPVMHNEEHLVIESPRAGEFKVGDCLYAVPRHICPTVALHAEAVVVREGKAAERWRVTARDRRLSV